MLGLALSGRWLRARGTGGWRAWGGPGYNSDPAVRDRARALALVDRVADAAEDAARGADLVILCVPVGAMAAAADAVAPGLSADALVSDVGSCKGFVADELRRALPQARIVPAHPV